MDIEDLFKTQEVMPVKMSQKEFVEKTKFILNRIADIYHKGWQSRAMADGEYPDESICDKCTGCGTFKDKNEELKDCFQDREQGGCYYRFCDHEQVGMDLEDNLDKVYELITVDEII